MRVLGMISGTSHDGIDVAVVDFTIDGGTLAGRIEHSGSVPYDPQLRSRIIAALPPAGPASRPRCELDTSIGQAFAAVAADVLAALGPDRPDLICSHGQTVFHWVVDGHARGTLQLGQPAWIAEATGRAGAVRRARAPTWRPAARARRWCRSSTGCCSSPTARPASGPGR